MDDTTDINGQWAWDMAKQLGWKFSEETGLRHYSAEADEAGPAREFEADGSLQILEIAMLYAYWYQ